jgi:predicted O-methyltransferase YrrM
VLVPDLTASVAEFEAAAETEPATGYLAEVYRSGVMYRADGQPVTLNDTSLGLTEGRILWHLARRMRPDVVVETGFGRGGSAAFFLAALAPWSGRLMSLDPAFRHWAGDTGITYIKTLGLSENHTLIEQPSELALANLVAQQSVPNLKLSYIDGSHHFDGTLVDFVYLDRMTEVGGIIAIDDAHCPAVRTVTSFITHNRNYQAHYATARLVLLTKTAADAREWCHFRPFHSSPKADWNIHEEPPDENTVPGATFEGVGSRLAG